MNFQEAIEKIRSGEEKKFVFRVVSVDEKAKTIEGQLNATAGETWTPEQGEKWANLLEELVAAKWSMLNICFPPEIEEDVYTEDDMIPLSLAGSGGMRVIPLPTEPDEPRKYRVEPIAIAYEEE